MLTNVASVRQIQTQYPSVYAAEGAEHVGSKAAGLLLRSLERAKIIIFDLMTYKYFELRPLYNLSNEFMKCTR
jgi:hypothetical protein